MTRRPVHRSPAPLRLAALAGLLLGAAAACGGDEEPLPRSLYELERMAFVPAGSARLEGFAGPRADFSLREPLLVDLFEVTRADWLHYLPEPGAELARPLDGSPWAGDTATWPAYMSLPDAVELALRRRMRLLTASEWLYAAVGRRASLYPWGEGRRDSVANTLELPPQRPRPVGTFEQGRSPFGCYDMLGNVWEWVADRVPGYGESPVADAGAGPGAGLAPLASVMGGSYRYLARPMYGPQPSDRSRPGFLAMTVDPRHLSDDIGVRCGATARRYLLEVGPEWDADSRCAVRLRAVGERWGTAAVELLEELRSDPGAPAALAHLLEGARRGAR